MQIKKLGCLLFTLLFLFSSLLLPCQATDTNKVVIGYIDYDGFITAQTDGTYTGYGIELLDKIAEYTDWEYEFVYDSWQNQLNNLKTGKIDFICHAQQTDQRKKDYLFSQYPSGSESSVLYVRADDERYYYNDYTHFNKMKIGFLRGSYQNKVFADYASTNNFTYQMIEYASDTEAFTALDQGLVDAVAMGSLANKTGYKTVCRFGSDPFYFMTGKNNDALLSSLNYALGEILGSNSSYINDLYDKYYGKTDNAVLNLTREEAEYIKDNGELIVGQLANRFPYCYYDDNNQLTGMFVEMSDLVAKKSGLKFTYEALPTGMRGVDWLEQTSGSVISGMMVSPVAMLSPLLKLSNTVFHSSVVIVGRSGETLDFSQHNRVAIPDGYIKGASYIAENYPNFTSISYHTTDDCLKAIANGQADIMLTSMYVARWNLQNPHYESLVIYPTYQVDDNMSFAVGPDEDPRLLSILNKAIALISDEEIDDIVVKYTVAMPYQYTASDVIYSFRVPFLVIGVLLAVVVGLIIAISIAKQRHYGLIVQKNAQLAEAYEQARIASASKSTFLAQMSHDIRTPMNAIIGMTVLARDHIDDSAAVSDDLDKIELSSHILLTLINDVLDMSAIESGKIKIAKQPFDFRQVISSLCSVYHTQCAAKGIVFDTKMLSTISEKLIGDSLRLNQILMNLLSNAVKFTDQGKVQLTIEQHQGKDNKIFIRFVVSDTGCGMSEDMLKRLSKPFEQESTETTARYGGSGLGISIVYNLVALMGGAITVKSVKNQGTTFTVELPFDVSGNNYKSDDVALEDIRVLVVDDDPDSRSYLSTVLTRMGVKFRCSASGPEALQALASASEHGKLFDICIIDWKMPRMDGLELTRQIRKLYDRDMIIIVASSYDHYDQDQEAQNAGVDTFVSKPLFQSTLFDLFMTLSKGRIHKLDKTIETPNFSGCRALLVEDNPINIQVATGLLLKANLVCEYASDGLKGVEKFEASPAGYYDIVLMDIQMPVMDGYTAAQKIRASSHPDAQSVPIVAMTADAFTEDVAKAIACGMNDHISKPIELPALYATLQRLIKPKSKTDNHA